MKVPAAVCSVPLARDCVPDKLHWGVGHRIRAVRSQIILLVLVKADSQRAPWPTAETGIYGLEAHVPFRIFSVSHIWKPKTDQGCQLNLAVAVGTGSETRLRESSALCGRQRVSEVSLSLMLLVHLVSKT